MEPINELSPRSYNPTRKLLKEAKTAMAWGMPDRESTGYTSSEFISIIGKLISRVEYLEKENEQLRCKAS